MKATGTVEFVDLEGGFFRLVADDGKRYTLIGPAGALKGALGSRVEVEGSIDEGFGIAMAGPQLRVDRLRKL
ncbi:MAG TPA: hypothetical protein VIR81_13835 [Myxococcales bacterium]|nr:hypothetical protein [Myxococcales bacterium]